MVERAREVRRVLRALAAIVVLTSSVWSLNVAAAQAQWLPATDTETYAGPFVVDGGYFRVATRVVLASSDSRYVVWSADQYAQDYGEYFGSEILVLDRATGEISAPTRGPGEPAIAGWGPLFFGVSADGSTIAYVGSRGGSNENALNVWRRGDGTIASFVPAGGTFGQPVLSSDGHRVAIRGHVYDITPSGVVEIPLDSLDGVSDITGMSGDGRYLSGDLVTQSVVHSVLVDATTDSRTILDVNLDGSENTLGSAHPILSRDGSTAVFAAHGTATIAPGDVASSLQLFVYSVASGDIRRVPPGCSFDGQWVSVTADGLYVGYGRAGCVVDLSDMTHTVVGGSGNSLTENGLVWARNDGAPGWGSIFVRERSSVPEVKGLAVSTPRLKLGEATSWSATVAGGVGSIVAAEYYVGADPGVGAATPISVGQRAVSGVLTGTQTGTYELGVRAQDGSGAWSETSRVTFVVYDPASVTAVTWSGRVLTTDGVPASGVDVSLSSLSESGVSVCGRDEVCTVSRTDAQGRFSFTVEARTDDNPIVYQLRLDRVAGSEARAGEVVLPVFSLGQGTISDLVADRSQDITLPALVKVTAQVQDAVGDPVADALVRLPKVDQSDEPPMTDLFWSPATGDESAATRTDAQGEATFYTFGSSTPLYVEAVFHDSENRAFSAFRSVTVSDSDATVVVRQPDPVTWSGHVLTTDGVPASGVDVSASALSPDGHPICGTDARCAVSRTDADGRFAVTVEARSGDNPVAYGLQLSRAAGAGARAGAVVLPVFSVGLGTATDFLSDRTQDVTMPSLVKVTVQTVDGSGTAVPGVELRLPAVDQSDEPPMTALYWTPAAEGGESASTVTDAKGEAAFYSFSSAVPVAVEARFPLAGGATVSAFRTVVAETGDTTLTIRAPGTATLSGRVLTTDGVPASGVDVSLSALSEDGRPICGDDQTRAVSRTDAGGRYSLTVEARSQDNPVDYQFSTDREADAQARAGDIVLPVFHLGQPAITDLIADRTQDVILPALARVTTHVQDAIGQAYRGATLHLGAVDQSDEPPMTALYWSPAPSDGESATTVTDDNGDAIFYSFGSPTPLQVRAVFPTATGAMSVYRAVVADTDTTLTVRAPDGSLGEADDDDVPNAVEDEVPSLSGSGTGDGNGDGLPDSTQDNVASLPSYGTTDEYVTIASPEGTELANVAALNPSSLPAPPADVAMPAALTSFTITGIPAGTLDQTISIFTASTADVVGYAKYDESNGWSLLPTGRFLIVDRHRIDITLTDGGMGDADGVVNGSIDDPGGPVSGPVVALTPRLSDTTPVVGQKLAVSTSAWGPAPLEYAFQWFRGSSAIDGATGSAYTVQTADLGSSLKVRVTGSKVGYVSVSKMSAATAAVKTGVLPAAPTPTLDDTTPVTNQKLSAVAGAWTPAEVTLTYQWYRRSPSGKVRAISGATGEQYQVRATDVGYRLRAKVTGSLTGYKSRSTYSAWAAKVGKAPFTSAPTPTIDGVVRVGMPLTAVPGSWDPSATLKYQWYRVTGTGKTTAISGATKASYKPTTTDQGRLLKLRVKGYRSGYVTTNRYSTLTSAVMPGMAGLTPKVTGTPVVDQELAAIEGIWTPAAPETTFSYQWYAKSPSDKVYAITGATTRTYQVEGRYAGYKMKVTVTGTATGFAPVTMTSAYTSTIEKANFTNQPVPTIDGTTQVGQSLTATEGDWRPAPAFSYQWHRSGTAITGATGNTYTLVTKDIGKTITVKVTARRTGYTTVPKTSAATTSVTA